MMTCWLDTDLHLQLV